MLPLSGPARCTLLVGDCWPVTSYILRTNSSRLSDGEHSAAGKKVISLYRLGREEEGKASGRKPSAFTGDRLVVAGVVYTTVSSRTDPPFFLLGLGSTAIGRAFASVCLPGTPRASSAPTLISCPPWLALGPPPLLFAGGLQSLSPAGNPNSSPNSEGRNPQQQQPGANIIERRRSDQQ